MSVSIPAAPPPETVPMPTSPLASLASPVSSEREHAWDRFVTSKTPLLLRVARAVTPDHDAAMDAYTFVLGQLREDGFKRLSAYRTTAGCSFDTWLAVVTRRLCLDHYRHKYGRVRGNDSDQKEARRERKSLVDLVSVAMESELPADTPDPSRSLERGEILAGLEAALNELAPRDRLLLRYRFDDGLSALQISRVMRFPTVFHVYRRVNSLLAVCRSALQRKGFRSSDV